MCAVNFIIVLSHFLCTENLTGGLNYGYWLNISAILFLDTLMFIYFLYTFYIQIVIHIEIELCRHLMILNNASSAIK